jgi:hypothetical protein
VLLYFFKKQRGVQILLQDEALDAAAKRNIFLFSNEHAARFTVANDLEKASVLLDKAQSLMNSFASGIISDSLKASFLSNVSCYYEK